jgi:hypothetical protein
VEDMPIGMRQAAFNPRQVAMRGIDASAVEATCCGPLRVRHAPHLALVNRAARRLGHAASIPRAD